MIESVYIGCSKIFCKSMRFYYRRINALLVTYISNLKQKRLMKVRFDKKSIQRNTVLITYFLILFMITVGIFSFADSILRWNILPRDIENYLYILIWSTALLIIGAFLINIMVSFNIISDNIENIANNTKTNRDEE